MKQKTLINFFNILFKSYKKKERIFRFQSYYYYCSENLHFYYYVIFIKALITVWKYNIDLLNKCYLYISTFIILYL